MRLGLSWNFQDDWEQSVLGKLIDAKILAGKITMRCGPCAMLLTLVEQWNRKKLKRCLNVPILQCTMNFYPAECSSFSKITNPSAAECPSLSHTMVLSHVTASGGREVGTPASTKPPSVVPRSLCLKQDLSIYVLYLPEQPICRLNGPRRIGCVWLEIFICGFMGGGNDFVGSGLCCLDGCTLCSKCLCEVCVSLLFLGLGVSSFRKRLTRF